MHPPTHGATHLCSAALVGQVRQAPRHTAVRVGGQQAGAGGHQVPAQRRVARLSSHAQRRAAPASEATRSAQRAWVTGGGGLPQVAVAHICIHQRA